MRSVFESVSVDSPGKAKSEFRHELKPLLRPEAACPVTEDATPLYWSEPETIAESLAQGYPDVNPLDLGIPALFRRILSLPGFSDDPDVATEEMLEQIQMLWHEEATE